MKVNSVVTGVSVSNVSPEQLNFRSKTFSPAQRTVHDEFVAAKKESQNNKAWYITGGLILAGIGAFLTHRAGLWGGVKGENKNVVADAVFKTVDEAKKYFEELGIDTIFRDVTEEHLPLLNRIKDDIKKIKELGVKFDKPDTITISDWHKAEEYEELCRKRGVNIERIEEYHAFCAGDKNGANHVFVNSSKPATDFFRHELGHANHHRGCDSYWEAKGVINHDFADKQLEILGQDIKIYRGTNDFKNIFHFNPQRSTTKFAFPNQNMETRYVYVKSIVDKMNEETHCYAPENLNEQVAYIFDGLVKGDKFSDEVMLYYDFAGGARIPNLKIDGKSYDEYIESLYNNPELIQKLKDNIKILKL